MGVDGCWCALWSSKPVWVVKSCLGGFDSHILSPNKNRQKWWFLLYFNRCTLYFASILCVVF